MLLIIDLGSQRKLITTIPKNATIGTILKKIQSVTAQDDCAIKCKELPQEDQQPDENKKYTACIYYSNKMMGDTYDLAYTFYLGGEFVVVDGDVL